MFPFSSVRLHYIGWAERYLVITILCFNHVRRQNAAEIDRTAKMAWTTSRALTLQARSDWIGLSALQLACVTLCILPYLSFIWNIWCISIICDSSLSLLHHFLLFFHTISNHLATSFFTVLSRMCAVIHVWAIELRQLARHRGQIANKALCVHACVRVEHLRTLFTTESIFGKWTHQWVTGVKFWGLRLGFKIKVKIWLWLSLGLGL